MGNSKKSNPSSSSALVDVLRRTGIDDTLIYNAVDEIRDMAGSNVFDSLNALEARLTASIETRFTELNGKFDTKFAEINGRIDSRVAEINGRLDTQNSENHSTRWALFAFVAVVTVHGLFKG